jgi:hypothetical protein
MGLGYDRGLGLACPLSDDTGFTSAQWFTNFFLAEVVKIIFPILRRPAVIGVDVAYLLGIVALIIVVISRP